MSCSRRVSPVLTTKMCYIQILPLAAESSPHVADAMSLQRIDHAGIPTFTLAGTLAELLYIIGKFEQLAPIGCDLRQVRTPLPPLPTPCMLHSLSHHNMGDSSQPRCPPYRVPLQPDLPCCLEFLGYSFSKSRWAAFSKAMTSA